ncbi:MAG TPA: hypothetical protein VNL34_02670 [Candidatus Nitrosotenuis sp.]|nr:hypothetical protein [Candidatus Nitrosotenuis sp.]
MRTSRERLSTMFVVSFVFLIAVAFSPQVFAQTVELKTNSGFTVVTGDDIKKNPAAMKILERIEQSKKILEELQNGQKQKTEHEKFIDEQRRIAKETLEKELASFNKKYEDYTPRNAFARFVAGVNSTHSAFFWDQFDYMNEKIKLANQAKEAILQSGGTYQEARAAYIKYATMPRVEMIKLIMELNIKHQFTDAEMQAYFDANGKLPRYEDDDVFVCYGCEKYEKIKAEMLAKEELDKQSLQSS